MKKSRFTEEQITFALRQAEAGIKVAEICRRDLTVNRGHHGLQTMMPLDVLLIRKRPAKRVPDSPCEAGAG